MSIGDVGGDRLAEILQAVQTGQTDAPEGTAQLKNIPNQRDSLKKHTGERNSENLGASTPNLPKPNKQTIAEASKDEDISSEHIKDFAEKMGFVDVDLSLQEAQILDVLFGNLTLQLQEGGAPFPTTVGEQLLNAMQAYQSVKVGIGRLDDTKLTPKIGLQEFKHQVTLLLKGVSTGAKIRADVSTILKPAQQAFTLSGGKENLTLLTTALTRITDALPINGFDKLFDKLEYNELAEVGAGAFITAVAAGSILTLDTFSEHLLLFPMLAAATGADKVAEEKEFKEIGTDLLINLFVVIADAKQLPSLEEGEHKEASKALSRLMQELIAKVVGAIVDAMAKGVKILSKMTEEYMQAKALDNEQKMQELLQKGIEEAAVRATALAFELMQTVTETLKACVLVDQKIEPLYRFCEKATEETASFTEKHLLKAVDRFVPDLTNLVERSLSEHQESLNAAINDQDALPFKLDNLFLSQRDVVDAFGKLNALEEGTQKQLIKELSGFLHRLFNDTFGVVETAETEKAA